MSNQTMKSTKIMVTTLTVAVVALLLSLFPIASVLAESVESIKLQRAVDEALGATELPEPTTVHLQAPHTARPPLTGQPYQQQPAAAQDDFRPGRGGKTFP